MTCHCSSVCETHLLTGQLGHEINLALFGSEEELSVDLI
jgi:hypothetical protein